MSRRARTVGWMAAALCACFATACTDEAIEQRAREAADKMRESIPDVHARAAAQNASASDIRLAQRALTAVHEYQGEIHGELDRVTINAIQAFQRSHGLADDGMLDRQTLERLRVIAPPE